MAVVLKVLKLSDGQVFSPKPIHMAPLMSNSHCRRGGGKNVRARRLGVELQNVMYDGAIVTMN